MILIQLVFEVIGTWHSKIATLGLPFKLSQESSYPVQVSIPSKGRLSYESNVSRLKLRGTPCNKPNYIQIRSQPVYPKRGHQVQ